MYNPSQNLRTVQLDVVGDVTMDRFLGDFKIKVFLSHADDMLKDRLRKEFLGVNPADSGIGAMNQAELLSELRVRIIDAPNWWIESKHGQDLFDSNVIVKLYEMCLEQQRKVSEEKKAAAAKAEEELRAEAEKAKQK